MNTREMKKPLFLVQRCLDLYDVAQSLYDVALVCTDLFEVVKSSLAMAYQIPPQFPESNMALDKITKLGRYFLALPILVFGIQHFLYAEFIVHLVPTWIRDVYFSFQILTLNPIAYERLYYQSINARYDLAFHKEPAWFGLTLDYSPHN